LVRSYSHLNLNPRLVILMIDRDSLFGIGGTIATFSGSLHEWIGVVAGSLTIVFMSVKIIQALRDRK